MLSGETHSKISGNSQTQDRDQVVLQSMRRSDDLHHALDDLDHDPDGLDHDLDDLHHDLDDLDHDPDGLEPDLDHNLELLIFRKIEMMIIVDNGDPPPPKYLPILKRTIETKLYCKVWEGKRASCVHSRTNPNPQPNNIQLSFS